MKMLLRDMDMGSLDAPLELAPKALNAVNMVDAVDILFLPVFHGPVLEAPFIEVPVSMEFVRGDGATLFDVVDHDGVKGVFLTVGDNLSHKVTVPLNHAKDNGLVGGSPASFAVPTAPDHGFVHFDMAREFIVAVNHGHILADFVRHAPSRFISHAKLALKFFGGNAVSGSGEQVHGIEPLLKRGMGILERGSRHGVNVVSAPLAFISGHFLDFVKLAFLPAFKAGGFIAESFFHQMSQTGIVIWEKVEELLNTHGLFHCVTSMSKVYQKRVHMSRG